MRQRTIAFEEGLPTTAENLNYTAKSLKLIQTSLEQLINKESTSDSFDHNEYVASKDSSQLTSREARDELKRINNLIESKEASMTEYNRRAKILMRFPNLE